MSALDPDLVGRLTELARERTGDDKVAEMFARALTNTLETTVHREPDGTTFVLTGDIPAMWLRDSTAQLGPYLLLLDDAPELLEMIVGLLRRQFAYILHDPYANAFNRDADGNSYATGDVGPDPWVWERKYEVDSLAFPILLAHRVWRLTGRTDFADAAFHRALVAAVDTLVTEQDHEARSTYRFERLGEKPSETLSRGGLGSPVARTGMTWSGFRPSDDACVYGYNVPANLFAATALAHVAELASELLGDETLAGRALTLRTEIEAGVARHGIVDHPVHGRIYAYEVDGLGHALLMDDANMPSLLSLPLLGVCAPDDEVYLATRAFALSPDNPYFIEGTAARGIGSPHTPDDYIWPIALAVQGLTTTDRDEKLALILVLRDTDAGTYLIHEGFHCDDPTRFTRPWFSWANSMFCELVLDYCGYGPLDGGLARIANEVFHG